MNTNYNLNKFINCGRVDVKYITTDILKIIKNTSISLTCDILYTADALSKCPGLLSVLIEVKLHRSVFCAIAS